MRNLALMWVLAACLMGCGCIRYSQKITNGKGGQMNARTLTKITLLTKIIFLVTFVDISYAKNNSDWEWSREKEAEFFYTNLLRQWEYDSIKPNLYNILHDNKKLVDSIVAIDIAVEVATRHYGLKMTSFGARQMGDNKEHWLVYCYPDTSGCWLMDEYYKTGSLLLISTSTMFVVDGCPSDVITVLISRENGQVLAIDTKKIFKSSNIDWDKYKSTRHFNAYQWLAFGILSALVLSAVVFVIIKKSRINKGEENRK
jgi:hypothetical protein